MDPITAMIIMALVSAGVSGANIANQRNMLQDQQDFNSAEAEKARDFASEGQRFDRMVGLGFNPDLAASSIMGSPMSTPYAASSPNAPQTPSVLDAFQNLLGKMPELNNQGKMTDAQVRHFNLLSDKLEIENGFLPITLQQQVDYWDTYVDKLKTEHWIDFENWKIISAQANWARPMAAAEYLDTMSRCQSAFAQADKFWAEASKDYAEADLVFPNLAEYYGSSAARQRSEIGVNEVLEGLYKQQKETEKWRTQSELYKSAQEYYDSEFRSMTLGMPFSGDLMQDLFMMRATDKGKKLSDRIWMAVLDGNRELYDFQSEQNMKHWWSNLFNSFANGGISNAVSTGIGTVPWMMYGAGKGSKVYPAGVPVNPKESSRVSKEVGKSYSKSPKFSDTHYKDAHGNNVRIDGYGNKWVNGKLVD